MAQPIAELDPREFEHSFDALALDALRGTPGLDALTRQLVKHGIERLFRIQYTGSNLQLTQRNYPEIFQSLLDACETLSIETPPLLYVEWDDAINASTVGSEQPLIVISSGCIDRLTTPELSFVLGHELGHIKCSHVVYHLMANSICSLGELVGEFTLGIGKLLTMPVRSALHRWSQMSELTADRAGHLACQDMNSALAVMVKMAGLPVALNDNLRLGEFIEQARDFEALDFQLVSKWMKFALHSTHTHPWTVLRAAELLKWQDGGDYDAVLQRRTRDRATKQTIDGKRFCRNCSFRLEGLEAFCPNCGTELLTASMPCANGT